MNKKIVGVAFLLVGVLIFAGAGCVKKSPAVDTQKQTGGEPVKTEQTNVEQTKTVPTDTCNSTTEIEPPNALAKELKSIFNEAGGDIKFIANFPKDAQTGDTYVYILKKKPTTTKLENAFKKHGYKIEMSGNIMVVSKDNLYLSVSLTDKGECQEVAIVTSDEPFKVGGAVTMAECKKMWDIAKLADYFKNDLYTSWTNTIKLYNYWYMLAAKYGVTPEALAKTCKAKLGL